MAPTQVQAHAFVTLNAELARSAEGILATASIDALRQKVESGLAAIPSRDGAPRMDRGTPDGTLAA